MPRRNWLVRAVTFPLIVACAFIGALLLATPQTKKKKKKWKKVKQNE